MLIKGITDEDFVNYKLPSMYIATATCSFKCDKEYGQPICQNSELVKQPNIEISTEDIVARYLRNNITRAIVFGGLEPLDQVDDVFDVVHQLRYSNLNINDRDVDDAIWNQELAVKYPKYYGVDPVVIYTGYTKEEAKHLIGKYSNYFNVIIKYGRYIPGQQPHYDPILGVYLASDNQYAERIS